jgi:hypothetical protein
MKFTVSDELLRDMFALCSFIIPEDKLVFIALRGVQPIQFGGSGFRSAHDGMAVERLAGSPSRAAAMPITHPVIKISEYLLSRSCNL